MIEVILKYVLSLFGLGYELSFLISFVTLATLVASLCLLADFIARTYLVRVLNLIITKAYLKLSKFLKERGVVTQLSRIAPAIVLFLSAPGFYSSEISSTAILVTALQLLASSYVILTLTRASFSVLDVVEDLYNQYEVSRKRPIKSYLQIAKIVFTIFAIVLLISLLLDKSPLAFFTGLGAAATILVLIFKDAIMSFLASVQLASYDMIRIGDWIQVDKYGADGDVIEIALTTVKVRNFDKTITTIPNYALVNEGVKNWRGMSESGGRRIKRSVRLDMSSVSFCDETLVSKLESHSFFKDFLAGRHESLKESFHQMSNVSLFRQYMEVYLRNREDIYSGSSFTFMIRELEPDELGLPIQFYVFTKTTDWVKYESIQSDIIDHVFSVLPFFNLKAYQRH